MHSGTYAAGSDFFGANMKEECLSIRGHCGVACLSHLQKLQREADDGRAGHIHLCDAARGGRLARELNGSCDLLELLLVKLERQKEQKIT